MPSKSEMPDGPVTFCLQCHAALAPEAPVGLCPACTLQSALRLDLPTIASDNESSVFSESPTPRRFGDYELLEEIARGGMGIVHRARQISLDRIVAVKRILSGADAGREFVRRFRTEAAAAAILQHPNIVAVHEVGVQDGQHFFSMDYIDGQNMAQLVGSRPMVPKVAARYVSQIASAVEYAHSKGILHRDLKPSNILVDRATNQPHVTDFGLARRMDGESSLTMTGQVLGSPHFMPPEQAGAERGKIGRTSDIYSLGGILYYLLTARAPFQGESLESTLHQVLHAEPVPPRLLNPVVPRDVEVICLKCLEKDPGRRYQTAIELAAELDRFLANEPIHARPAGPFDRAWRWCRRHPVVASLGAFSILLLVIIGIGAPIAILRVDRARAEAQDNARELSENLYLNRVALAYRELSADRPSPALQQLRRCPVLLRDWEWHFVRNAVERGRESMPYVANTPAPGPIRSLAVSSNGRDLGVIAGRELQLWNLTAAGHLEFATTLGAAPSTSFDELRWLDFSPDGSLLLAPGPAFQLDLWDVRKHSKIRSFPNTNLLVSIDFHPSGKIFATASRPENFVRLWEVSTGRLLRSIPVKSTGTSAQSVAFSPDGRWIATGTWGASPDVVALCDVQTGEHLFDAAELDSPVVDLAFSPDNRLLVAATVSQGDNIFVFDTANRKRVSAMHGHSGSIATFSLHPKGSRVASVSFDRELKLWDVRTGREVLSVPAHPDHAACVAFTPDGSRLITAGFDGTLRVWDGSPSAVPESPEVSTLPMNAGDVWSVVFHPDGRLFSSGPGSGLRVVPSPWMSNSPQIRSSMRSAISADGRLIANAAADTDGVQVLDAQTLGQLFRAYATEDPTLDSAALSPDGVHLVAGGAGGQLFVWRWRQGQRYIKLGDQGTWIQCLRFSPQGNLLASLGEDGLVLGWDASRLDAPQTPRVLMKSTPLREFGAISFSPDGSRLVAGDGFGGLQIIRPDTGERDLHIGGAGGIVIGVAFSPDGHLIASGGTDHTVRIWDAHSGRLLETHAGHEGAIFSVAFSPNGRFLASGSADHSVKIWRVSKDIGNSMSAPDASPSSTPLKAQ